MSDNTIPNYEPYNLLPSRQRYRLDDICWNIDGATLRAYPEECVSDMGLVLTELLVTLRFQATWILDPDSGIRSPEELLDMIKAGDLFLED